MDGNVTARGQAFSELKMPYDTVVGIGIRCYIDKNVIDTNTK